MRVGIVGLPNVGKSTLFNALLKKRVALSANYPFATIEPNMGVVEVPDKRLGKLAELVAKEEGMMPQEILKQVQDDRQKNDSGQAGMTDRDFKKYFPPLVPAVVEFVDIAGLVKGASIGAGLGNQFLSHIREVDAIIHVLRDFTDPNIIREGSVEPQSDKEIVETELALADLQVVEKLVIGQEKAVRGSRDPLEQTKLDILKQVQDDLSKSHLKPSYAEDLDSIDERLKDWFKTLPLLTIKPVLYVLNVSENEYSQKLHDRKENDYADRMNKSVILGRSEATTPESKAGSWTSQDDKLIISAKLEEELADYSEEERLEYLKSLGIDKTGLERLIIKAYDLLGLMSFLTAGKKEIRAWTIKKGTKAPQAAGVIHTDFEKKFIRAQVIEYAKLMEAGSYKTAKDRGWIKTEGKDYIMKDGDVVEFLIGS